MTGRDWGFHIVERPAVDSVVLAQPAREVSHGCVEVSRLRELAISSSCPSAILPGHKSSH